MAFIDITPTRDRGSVVPSPWDAARGAWVRVRAGWAARRNRHEIEAMLTFEPALLADIGVSRDDVVQALTTRDPSAALERAARPGGGRGR